MWQSHANEAAEEEFVFGLPPTTSFPNLPPTYTIESIIQKPTPVHTSLFCLCLAHLAFVLFALVLTGDY
jgi:hypothetical protein